MAGEVRFNYSGSRVLVTGGSNGIGLAIAEAYASSGAEVSITGTARQKSDYPHDLSGFTYHRLDMQDGTAVDEVVSGVGEKGQFVRETPNNVGVGDGLAAKV